MKTVLHLMSTHVFSGAENVACQIINAFKEDKSYRMIYVSEISDNKSNLDDRNIQYYKIKKFNYWNIRKAIKELKPDIIHAHDIKASVIAALFYKKTKIVSHVHANHENMRKKTIKTMLYNLSCKYFKNIIWVSNSALEDYIYKENVLSKSIVLYNAIDANEIHENIVLDKKQYPEYDIIYLGRLTYQKNPLRLVRIIAKAKEEKNDIKVAIVGDGELKSEVINTIKKLHLENNITVYGFVQNPYKILNSSKIMIMTSRYEGTPMCVLEAMSLGKPIVSTPTDGISEIIENTVNGFTLESDEKLVKTILNLLDDKEKLEKIGINSSKSFEKMGNMQQYKEKINNIYNFGCEKI